MKLFLIITSLFFTLQSNGQCLKKIKQILASKDFIAFNAFFKKGLLKCNNRNAKSNVSLIWELKRDITATFKEYAINVLESFQIERNSNSDTVLSYRINILATSKEIIYYDFGEKESYGRALDNRNFNNLDSFRNNVLIANFKKDFFDTYKDSINQIDLFNNSHVYGLSCGIAGQNPDMREESDLIIKSKNAQLLTKWLKSANTEKQVYGIDGLYQLKKNGYTLTKEQLRLINIIKNKKGSINVCKGCVQRSVAISSVVKNIIGEHLD